MQLDMDSSTMIFERMSAKAKVARWNKMCVVGCEGCGTLALGPPSLIYMLPMSSKLDMSIERIVATSTSESQTVL